MAAVSLGTVLAVAGGVAAVSAAAHAGATAYTQHQTNKANKTARRRQEAAEARQAAAARAATAGQTRQRLGYGENMNTGLRGIQATMLASRKAQNDGNDTLGG